MTSAQSEANSDNTSSKNYRFDSVVVFGQGPVKPVLLEEEVTSQQAAKWQEYRTDPYTHEEPDFWLIQQPKYLQQLEKIKQEEKITEEEKLKLIEFKRQEWQRMGWFAMKTARC